MFKSEDYIDREVVIKSTGVIGTIKNVLRRRSQGGGLAVRFLVVDAAGKTHELMPHEINKNKNEHIHMHDEHRSDGAL